MDGQENGCTERWAYKNRRIQGKDNTTWLVSVIDSTPVLVALTCLHRLPKSNELLHQLPRGHLDCLCRATWDPATHRAIIIEVGIPSENQHPGRNFRVDDTHTHTHTRRPNLFLHSTTANRESKFPRGRVQSRTSTRGMETTRGSSLYSIHTSTGATYPRIFPEHECKIGDAYKP